MSRSIKYDVHGAAIQRKTIGMGKIFIAAAASLTMVGAMAAPAFAAPATDNGHNTAHGATSSTTLDACGYFIGTQVASEGSTTTLSDGSTYTTERGTWTGVNNNYVNTPVASLGEVQGSFSETYTTNSNGDVSGVETFNSNAGKINQTFTYGPDVVGGYSVSVTATRDLSFLTSNTNGGCYAGPFPRP